LLSERTAVATKKEKDQKDLVTRGPRWAKKKDRPSRKWRGMAGAVLTPNQNIKPEVGKGKTLHGTGTGPGKKFRST